MSTPDFLDDLASLIDAAWAFDSHIRRVDLSEQDVATLVSVLDAVRDLGYTLKSIDESVVEALTDKVGDPVSVDGVVAEVKWSKPRKQWENERLAPLVSEEIIAKAIDPETGTLTVPVSQLIPQLLQYVGVSYWKVTALKALGLNPDEFCEVGKAKPSVVLRKTTRPGSMNPEN
jgi:hypothetical protein